MSKRAIDVGNNEDGNTGNGFGGVKKQKLSKSAKKEVNEEKKKKKKDKEKTRQREKASDDDLDERQEGQTGTEEFDDEPANPIAMHDLLVLEHSIALIQENLNKIVSMAPTAKQLSKYVRNLISKSSDETNGEITTRILLLAKSHKIQLAAQLKTMYMEEKLKIFDQIINFTDNTMLETAEDVQLLLKEKNQSQVQKHKDSASHDSQQRMLPPLPIIYDSILEAKVFIHKSATNSDLHSSKYDQVQSNNERLEYLGDAILEAVMSDILDFKYTDFDEGQLSFLRSVMVKNETIEVISRSYKFPERQQDLLKSHRIKTDLSLEKNGTNKRIADLFEAYIGALFIDKGRNGKAYDEIKEWLLQVYDPIFKEFESSDELKYTHLSKRLVDDLLQNKLKKPVGKKIIFDEEPGKTDKSVKQKPEVTNKTQLEPPTKFPVTITSAEEVDKLAKGNLYAVIGSAKLHPIYKTKQFPTNTGKPCIVECRIGTDLLGIGEGRNLKDASARAAKAALLNKTLIEKYHLIRMMTPREQSRVSEDLSTSLSPPKINSSENKDQSNDKRDSKPFKKDFGRNSVLRIPHNISQGEGVIPDSSAKTKLVELLSSRNCDPEIISERDTSTNSILPLFKTSLKINGKVISTCVDASKKKGANKVSQWLLDEAKAHGNDIIFKELDL